MSQFRTRYRAKSLGILVSLAGSSAESYVCHFFSSQLTLLLHLGILASLHGLPDDEYSKLFKRCPLFGYGHKQIHTLSSCTSATGGCFEENLLFEFLLVDFVDNVNSNQTCFRA